MQANLVMNGENFLPNGNSTSLTIQKAINET